VPIGTDGAGNALDNGSSYGFVGNFDGLGYAIDKLTINRPTANFTGLFGFVGGNGVNTIANLSLTNASIVGGPSYVGGLIGWNADLYDPGLVKIAL
ncbi:hypothetical protein ABTM67_19075, partial [Acinetobacter baumannii]